MFYKKLFLTASLVISGLGTVHADAYLETSLFAYSKPLTIHGILDNWQGGVRQGDVAFTHNWVEIGATHGNWKLGIIKRYDYEFELSDEAAEFLYRIKNRLPLETGKTYQLAYKVRHTYSNGVRLSRKFTSSSQLSFELGASYLHGLQLTEGALQGNATALAENDYDFEFDVDYFYTKDSLFGRQVARPQGDGFSLDLNLAWNPAPEVTMALNIRDLFGRIYWRNTPRTNATASSDVKDYDEDGYVKYKPAISGVETYEDFVQRLPMKITFVGSYELRHDFYILGRIYHTRPIVMAQLGAQYSVNESTDVYGFYMLDVEAFTLGYKQGNFSFAVTSDALEYSSAHTFGIDLAYLVTF